MSEGKLAAQVAHAVGRLLIHGQAYSYIEPTEWNCSIVVLGVSDKKFDELAALHCPRIKGWCVKGAIQVDNGVTEVPAGTQTAAAWIENE